MGLVFSKSYKNYSIAFSPVTTKVLKNDEVAIFQFLHIKWNMHFLHIAFISKLIDSSRIFLQQLPTT